MTATERKTLLLFVVVTRVFGAVKAGPANPYPFQFEQEDGNITTNLFYHGSSPFDSFISDADGYTVIKDDKNSSRFVYAKTNETNRALVSSGILIGESDTISAGTAKRLRPSPWLSSTNIRNGRRLVETHQRKLNVPSNGTLKNLVVLMRFQNHKNRILPAVEDFDVLFNHDGEEQPHHDLAPTGSVWDVFRINSYGKFSLESEVYGWVDLPESESYYAGGVGGFATPEYVEALHSAMNALLLEERFGIVDFSQFDSNGDGKIDMVTLVHSGFASEVSGPDQDGAENDDRIWSHHRKIPRKDRWYPNPNQKSEGAYVYQYATVPALYGVEGTSIGRIGVTSHEIGHAIGE